MAERQFEVIIRATELMQYTLQVTSNRKRYPVKYISLVQRIQNTSMDIYVFLHDANRLNLSTSKAERLELQTKAVNSCDKLSCFVEISMNLKIIGSDTVEAWQKHISDVKYMTLAWRKKDSVR